MTLGLFLLDDFELGGRVFPGSLGSQLQVRRFGIGHAATVPKAVEDQLDEVIRALT